MAYAGVPVPIIAVGLSLIDGVVFNARFVVEQSMIQGSVESHFLARVFAVQGLLLSGMSILSTVGMSYLADRMGIQAVYVLGGVGYFVVFAIALGSKAFRRYVLPTERVAGSTENGRSGRCPIDPLVMVKEIARVAVTEYRVLRLACSANSGPASAILVLSVFPPSSPDCLHSPKTISPAPVFSPFGQNEPHGGDPIHTRLYKAI
ncbi:MAG: hypothetical protein K6T83_12180 [Alicyclobacillus sp.]|nr:hypothetical protein [Alicyclobacillus sp.]